MLTLTEARKKGIDACIEKLGRDFVNQYKDTACYGYGEEEEYVFCR